MKRQLSESDKKLVLAQQRRSDGSLRCFISDEIIGPGDDFEYDHVQAFAADGETSLDNIRIALKHFNRRKGVQTLYDVRDNLRLERLFDSKKNDIRLQDILDLKEVSRRNIHAVQAGDIIQIDDSTTSREFPLFHDAVLNVPYFYGRIPISWIENDDQEGLQPRVIDFKRLTAIRDHLKAHPQLAPSIGRLIGGRLKLFDGQHKLAAQVLNNREEVDLKVYVSPVDAAAAKRLFESLMRTNLDAHSKLKQIPFYTSTMFERLSVIHQELLGEFIAERDPDTHTEANFIAFLTLHKGFAAPAAKEVLRSATCSSALAATTLRSYVAAASKDSGFPITLDLLAKTLFRSTLYLDPSSARFGSEGDCRKAETDNFAVVADILVQETGLTNWVPNAKGRTLTNEQTKARRIWHKGSVLTWAPYLKSILFYALHIMTNEERERMLYRAPVSDPQKHVIEVCLHRLFAHPMWDDPDAEIDSLLVSAQKQEDLFNRKGLTEKHVLSGE